MQVTCFGKSRHPPSESRRSIDTIHSRSSRKSFFAAGHALSQHQLGKAQALRQYILLNFLLLAFFLVLLCRICGVSLCDELGFKKKLPCVRCR